MHRVSFGSNKSLGVDGQIQTSDFKWHERTYLFRALSQISALSGQMLSKSEGVKEQRLHLTASLLYVCSFYGSVNGNPIAGKAFNPNSVTLVDSGIHCIHCCLFELFVLGLNHGRWVCVRVCREENIHLELQSKQSLTGDFKEENIIIHAVKYWEPGEICKRVLTQYLPFLYSTYILQYAVLQWYCATGFKETAHPKLKVLRSFTCPSVVPNLWLSFFSQPQKEMFWRMFKMLSYK